MIEQIDGVFPLIVHVIIHSGCIHQVLSVDESYTKKTSILNCEYQNSTVT